MKIFMTGGTGNIGQYVTLALLERGHEIVLLTRTPDRVPAFSTLPGVTVVQGNMMQLDVVENALQGCDAVIHIALGWGNDPVNMLMNDTRISAFLMDAAERAGVKQFIYTSSTAAMGNLRSGMDETALCFPEDLYGATKASTEMYLMGFNRYYGSQGRQSNDVGMRRNVIRPGYTYSNPAFEGGASQSDTRFLDIAKAILKNEPLTFDAFNGTQFLSAREIAQLYVKLVESDLNREIFLALGSTFTGWGTIAQIAKDMTPGCTSEITIRPCEGEPSFYNVSKMERVFGLRFEGDEDLRAHITWNLERARKLMEGEKLHNTNHEWSAN